MKKYQIVLIISILLVVGVIFTVFCINKSSNVSSSKIGVFNLSEYQWEMETYPSNKNVGEINDANIAIDKAKELWIEKYSVINGQSYDPIIHCEEIKVEFDVDNDCWHIYGTLPTDILGAAPNALIETNGKVLAVWMG